MASNNEIKALLQLLDDPDEEIFSAVSKQIATKGEGIIPELEKVWETSLNSILQERIENLIQEIQFSSILKKLKEWKESEEKDILYGAFLIAKCQYPDLSFKKLESEIDKVVQDIWLEINDNLTALEKVRVINHVFYQIHNYSGNNTNFYAPQNSYLNHVLENKKGNPISLGILYQHIAKKLELPILGVNLPKNYILAFLDSFSLDDEDSNVLFYINPYNKGIVLGKREIDYFVDQQKLGENDNFYQPCSNVDILQRLIKNIIHSYEKLGYPDKVDTYISLYNTLND